MLAVSGELNPKAGGPGVLVADREGGRGPDLHRGRGRRPLARDARPARAPPALALPLPQAERPLPDVRRLRRPRHPDRLPRSGGQHPRPPGPRPAQQRLRRRPGQGPRRPALSRGRRRTTARVDLRLPASSWPATRRPAEVDQARAFLDVAGRAAPRARRPGSRSPGRRSCPTGPTRPRPPPGSTSPWRCSTGTSSSTSLEPTGGRDGMPEPIPTAAPARSGVRPRAAASSSARAGNGFGLLGLAYLLEREAGRRPAAAPRTRWPRRPATSRRRRSGASSCS